MELLNHLPTQTTVIGKKGTKKIVFGEYFTQFIDESWFSFGDDVEEVVFGNNWDRNPPFGNHCEPRDRFLGVRLLKESTAKPVRKIVFGDAFNSRLNSWVHQAEVVCFGRRFNQPLLSQSNNKALCFGEEFNQPLAQTHFPSLETLILGKDFNQSFRSAHFPVLKTLQLGEHFSFPLASVFQACPSLQILVLPPNLEDLFWFRPMMGCIEPKHIAGLKGLVCDSLIFHQKEQFSAFPPTIGFWDMGKGVPSLRERKELRSVRVMVVEGVEVDVEWYLKRFPSNFELKERTKGRDFYGVKVTNLIFGVKVWKTFWEQKSKRHFVRFPSSLAFSLPPTNFEWLSFPQVFPPKNETKKLKPRRIFALHLLRVQSDFSKIANRLRGDRISISSLLSFLEFLQNEKLPLSILTRDACPICLEEERELVKTKCCRQSMCHHCFYPQVLNGRCYFCRAELIEKARGRETPPVLIPRPRGRRFLTMEEVD